MRYIFFILAFFISQALMACGSTRYVSTQEQFDEVVNRINSGEGVNIVLRKGTYILKNNLKAKSPLNIKGNNATICSYDNYFDIKDALKEEDGYRVYRIHSDITPYSLFYDTKGQLIGISESVETVSRINVTKEDIVAGDNLKSGSIVKIAIPENLIHLKNKEFSKAFGCFDCGWQTVNFQLEKSDDEYFYCKTLNNCRTRNYSYERTAYKKPIRFVIYNAEKKKGLIYYDSECLYVPIDVGVVYHLNCVNLDGTTPNIIINSDLSIKGLNFLGLNGLLVKSLASSVCEIEDCEFNNCLGYALSIVRKQSNNVKEAHLSNCSFKHCSLLNGCVVELLSPCDNNTYFDVNNTEVSRYPNGYVTYKNPNGAIKINGNAILNKNIVYNTPRCHLFLGQGKIIAQGNVLYNTDIFNSQIERNLSNDWGFVYCNYVFSNTEESINNTTHKIELEKNLLYGAYAYGGDARGIFIDDGRGDVECRNNVILNTQSYSIDSRNVKMHNASSVRNRYEHNIVTSRYRLAAGELVKGDDVPTTKANLVYADQENVTTNAIVLEEETRNAGNLDYSCEVGKIRVSRNMYEEIRKTPAWKYVKRFVRKNR